MIFFVSAAASVGTEQMSTGHLVPLYFISVPLAENETMHIGYVLNENQELSELGKSYLEELRKYAPANP